MIYGAVLVPGVREIRWSILAVCELVPPLWLCPGTGWLLSTCLTNRAPLLQISHLPIPVDIMRPDLQAARGVCAHLWMCVFLVAQRDGGGENTQEMRDLLITLCSVSPPLTLFLSPPSLGFPFSPRLFREGCRGQCFWLCSVLQTFSDLPFYKTSFQKLIECTDVGSIIMEREHEGNKLLYQGGPTSLFFFINAPWDDAAALWISLKCKCRMHPALVVLMGMKKTPNVDM